MLSAFSKKTVSRRLLGLFEASGGLFHGCELFVAAGVALVATAALTAAVATEFALCFKWAFWTFAASTTVVVATIVVAALALKATATAAVVVATVAAITAASATVAATIASTAATFTATTASWCVRVGLVVFGDLLAEAGIVLVQEIKERAGDVGGGVTGIK
jgi:hypothetical protein